MLQLLDVLMPASAYGYSGSTAGSRDIDPG